MMRRPQTARFKHHIVWVSMVLLTIVSMFLYALVYFPRSVYSNSIELLCRADYTSGFMVYAYR